MPYNLVNYACGLTTIPLGAFALATAIGTAPRTFAYVALGGSFGDLGSPEALIAIGVLVGMGVVGLFLVRRDLLRERAARAAAQRCARRATSRASRAAQTRRLACRVAGRADRQTLDLEQARRPRAPARQARR